MTCCRQVPAAAESKMHVRQLSLIAVRNETFLSVKLAIVVILYGSANVFAVTRSARFTLWVNQIASIDIPGMRMR